MFDDDSVPSNRGNEAMCNLTLDAVTRQHDGSASHQTL
jgi:hypothetical protein